MRNVVTRRAHRKWTRDDPSGVRRGHGLAVGALFGAATGLAVALTGRWLRLPPAQVLHAALAALFGGAAVVGLTVHAVARWAIGAQLAGDYDGPTAPDLARDFAWRLPCAWLRDSAAPVYGGIYLNAGGDRLHFAPDAYSLPLEKSFDIAAPAAIDCARPRTSANGRTGRFLRRPPRALEIAADGSRWYFSVPAPDAAAARLRAILAGDEPADAE